jgi:hypothetical protein
MWPTPTTMDTKEDALKHATKLLQGKTHRASGEPIQKSLVDKVMMEEIKKNPELMKIYEDHEMIVRPNLPAQQEFVDYLREQTTIKELAEKTDIKKTTIEHWFRKDQKGFSHPSIEDWEKIKPHLKQIKYNQEMTLIETKEWKNKNQMYPTPRARDWKDGYTVPPSVQNGTRAHTLGTFIAEKEIMWPTPTTKGYGHASMGQTMIFRKKVEAGEMTEQQAQEMLGCTLRPPRMEKWDYPKKETQPSEKDRSSGTLNPVWVEWLMGYPTGYTDLDV